MKPKIIVSAGILFFSGCIFGAGGSTDNNGFDLGGEGRDSGSMTDTGTTPVDMRARSNDLGTAEDVGRDDDQGTPTEDAGPGPTDMGGTDQGGPVDMGGPAPWTVRNRVTLAGGDTAGAGAAAQVSMFKDGFLAGYTSEQGQTWIGWFDSQSADPLDTDEYGGNLPTLDFAGDDTYGYAAMVRNQEQILVRYEASPAGDLVPRLESYIPSNDSISFTEMAAAMDGEYAYTAETRRFNGQHLDIGVFSDDYYSLGSAYVPQLVISNLEIIGNNTAAPNRRLIVTGHSGGQYTRAEFNWDQNSWSESTQTCGQLSGRNARVVPVVERWVLANAPDISGPVLTFAECVDSGGTLNRSAVTKPDQDVEVTDFDIAEESLGLATPGIAWIQDGTVWFGVLDYAPAMGMASIQLGWQVPAGPDPLRVRTAYNPSNGLFAVIVHSMGSVEIFILEKV